MNFCKIALSDIIVAHMDVFGICFFSFILSLSLTFIFSKAFLDRVNFLLLRGRLKLDSKKMLHYKSAGGLIILAGSILPLLLLIFTSLVPVLLFVKIIFLCVVVVFSGIKIEFFQFNKYVLLIPQLVFSFLIVFFLNFPVPDVGAFYGYSLAVAFSFLCVLFVRFLNTFERIAVVFSIGLALFGAVLGLYASNAIIFASNISVLGALVSFSYFNFNKTKKIHVGFNGELLIGLSFAGLCLFCLREGLDVFVYNRFLPFALLVFSYPAIDVLQLYSIKAVNFIFNKHFPEDQIHICILKNTLSKINLGIITIFILIQFLFLGFVALSFGFS
jgi:hypothetical protein